LQRDYRDSAMPAAQVAPAASLLAVRDASRNLIGLTSASSAGAIRWPDAEGLNLRIDAARRPLETVLSSLVAEVPRL
jgi:hypothetical protein